jgi:hypothetical protein
MISPKNVQLPSLETMVLVLVVWLCALPFISVLVVPVFGIRTAFGTSLALLFVMLLFCWGRCISGVTRFYWAKKTAVVLARSIRSLLSGRFYSEKGS